MWRWLGLGVLLFVWVLVAVVIGATKASAQHLDGADPDKFTVVEVKKPVMCVSPELKINAPCSFVVHMWMKARGGDSFCTLHSCPKRI